MPPTASGRPLGDTAATWRPSSGTISKYSPSTGASGPAAPCGVLATAAQASTRVSTAAANSSTSASSAASTPSSLSAERSIPPVTAPNMPAAPAPPLTATRANDVSNAGAPHTILLGHSMPTLPARPRPGVDAVPTSASIMPIAVTNGRPWKACIFTSGRMTSENVNDASPALQAHQPADAPSRPASRAASSSVPTATAFISIIYIRPNSPTIWPTRSSGSLTSTPL